MHVKMESSFARSHPFDTSGGSHRFLVLLELMGCQTVRSGRQRRLHASRMPSRRSRLSCHLLRRTLTNQLGTTMVKTLLASMRLRWSRTRRIIGAPSVLEPKWEARRLPCQSLVLRAWKARIEQNAWNHEMKNMRETTRYRPRLTHGQHARVGSTARL